MSWTLLVFDHKTPQWLEQRLSLYFKRLSYWVDIQHKLMPPAALNQVEQSKQLDWERFQANKVLAKKTLVVFDEQGLTLTSEKLAKYLDRWEQQDNVCFVIGPSYGLSSLWREQAHSCLSLSSLTLTHEFAQLIATEQLYRAFTILKGLPYHIQ